MAEGLRQYQKEGISKLTAFLKKSGSAYLADEMGLGKTLQAIATARLLEAKNILVVCPASLRLNWAREFSKWWPEIPFEVLGTSRARRNLEVGVTIISYELSYRDVIVPRHEFDMLILDEAHYIKTKKSKRSKACLGPLWNRSKYRVLLSGTPMPNGVIDAFTTFNKCCPEYFSDYYKFGFRYTEPKKNWFTGHWEFKGGKNLAELRRLALANFMVRRKKDDVLTELPAKVYTTIPVEVMQNEYRLTEEQLYSYEQGKLAYAADHIATMRRGLGMLKVPAAVEHIKYLLESQTRIVVFCSHTSVIDQLKGSFEKTTVFVIDGRASQTERDRQIQQFQSNLDKPMVMLCQMQAAGVGINLTAASFCVFVELDWTPAVMAQCADRLHRLGQKNCVQVHYLIAQDTLDSQIFGALESKIKAISGVMG